MKEALLSILSCALFVFFFFGSCSGNDQMTKALYDGALSGDTEGAIQAIRKGAEIEARNRSMSVKGSWTILMRVVNKGDLAMAKTLIEAGANVNAQSNKGSTSLTLAAEQGYAEIIKLLLSHGANLNAKTDHDNTPLMYGAEYGHLKVIETLLAAGADYTLKDKDGETALMMAKRKNHLEVIRLLEAQGVKE